MATQSHAHWRHTTSVHKFNARCASLSTRCYYIFIQFIWDADISLSLSRSSCLFHWNRFAEEIARTPDGEWGGCIASKRNLLLWLLPRLLFSRFVRKFGVFYRASFFFKPKNHNTCGSELCMSFIRCAITSRVIYLYECDEIERRRKIKTHSASGESWATAATVAATTRTFNTE